MSRLHIFDMDGTLLQGSACIELSRAYGVHRETIEIEETWARGEISDNGFWELCLPLWRGMVDADIDAAFAASPWLEGVRDVFADIRARGEWSVVISQSPKFFVDRLRDWGATYSYGALVTPGNHYGAERLISRDEKLHITNELLYRHGLTHDQCIAYGDSSSDLTLFERLPLCVAVNAKPAIRDLAKAHYDGPSIWEAYQVGRRLIEDAVRA